jgi:hypothetical protein
MQTDSRWWLWGCAVAWVATRDRGLADSFMNRDWHIFGRIVRAIDPTEEGRSAAQELALQSIVALHSAGAEGRLIARAVVDGRSIAVSPEAWVKGTVRERSGSIAIAGAREGVVTIGGVEPLLRPDDVIGVFPSSGG